MDREKRIGIVHDMWQITQAFNSYLVTFSVMKEERFDYLQTMSALTLSYRTAMFGTMSADSFYLEQARLSTGCFFFIDGLLWIEYTHVRVEGREHQKNKTNSKLAFRLLMTINV